MNASKQNMHEQPAIPAAPLAIVSAVRLGARAMLALSRHWLAAVNLFVAIFAGLPLLAPYLGATGYAGWSRLIVRLYSAVCHQMPSRSFFIWGYQMAYDQRLTAIYTSILVGGLMFTLLRGRLRRLGIRPYLLLIAPMALDGFTQLFGLRESTWLLRVMTGTLFGLATVWLVYPVLEWAFRELHESLQRGRSSLPSVAA